RVSRTMAGLAFAKPAGIGGGCDFAGGAGPAGRALNLLGVPAGGPLNLIAFGSKSEATGAAWRRGNRRHRRADTGQEESSAATPSRVWTAQLRDGSPDLSRQHCFELRGESRSFNPLMFWNA